MLIGNDGTFIVHPNADYILKTKGLLLKVIILKSLKISKIKA